MLKIARRADSDGMLPLPRYHQIYLVLREQLAEGRFGADAALPGEIDLAGQFGVSRVTMRAALDRLTEEGLIVRQRGRGTFARPAPAREPARANLAGLLENLVSMGLKTTVRLIDLDVIAAPPEVAAGLGIAAGDKVQKAVRVRSHKGAPFSHITTFVPEAFGRSFGRKELSAKPMLSLLEESGLKAASAEQTVSARLADQTVAPLLEVELGAALLSVNRIVYDERRRPIQLLRGLYRPDRYEYQMTLSRVGDETRVWVSRDRMPKQP